MKYTAPKAEIVSLEVSSAILLESPLFCLIYAGDETTDDGEGGGGDQLPDFYSYE